MPNLKRGLRSQARKALPNNLLTAFQAARDEDTILVDWVHRGLVHNNWGDEIAPHLVELLSGKKVVNHRDIFNPTHKTVYTTIGSMLGSALAHDLVVWGSGFVTSGQHMRVTPKQVCAVRGRLSYQRLRDTGIACPEVFGDPALLYSRFYRPATERRYRLGIIPHIRDLDLPIAHRLGRLDDVRVIDIRAGITEVADQINTCEHIASASLHGLVAAASYEIPASWVQFSDRAAGDGFKFRDYLLSIGRTEPDPLVMDETTSVDEVLDHIPPHKLDLDVEAFLDACPFLDRAVYESNLAAPT